MKISLANFTHIHSFTICRPTFQMQLLLSLRVCVCCFFVCAFNLVCSPRNVVNELLLSNGHLIISSIREIQCITITPRISRKISIIKNVYHILVLDKNNRATPKSNCEWIQWSASHSLRINGKQSIFFCCQNHYYSTWTFTMHRVT